MTKKIVAVICVLVVGCTLFVGCIGKDDTAKIGVSFGVGKALRWPKEELYMLERAEENGAKIISKFNTTDEPKTQKQDCFELIDGGIDVLILIPRDTITKTDISDILDYAKKKGVKVVSYARAVMGFSLDLLIGYDSKDMGRSMANIVAEETRGDYIVIRGADGDNNAKLLYSGMMQEINKYVSESLPEDLRINVVSDFSVPNWSAEECKKLFAEQFKAKGGDNIKAVLAPNDNLAGAVIEVLAELGYTKQNMPFVSGMDADLAAAQRIAEGTQTMTIYMDLKNLAYTAVDLACKLALGEKVRPNDTFDNDNEGKLLDAYLIKGIVVVQSNLRRVLVDSGYYKEEDVYGLAGGIA